MTDKHATPLRIVQKLEIRTVYCFMHDYMHQRKLTLMYLLNSFRRYNISIEMNQSEQAEAVALSAKLV